MNPTGAIIGDNTGVGLPEATPDTSILSEEKKMAKFSRTAEFKRLKDYCEGRIEFYQQKLPNGAEIGLDVAPSTEDWRVANRVIGEFKLLMNIYETAAEVTKDAPNG